MKALRLLAVAVVAGLIIFTLIPYVQASSLLVRASGVGGAIGRVAAWDARALTETLTTIPTRHGALRARVYRPSSVIALPILLVTGVHPTGIDESRLVKLARDLASTGISVITPEISDLLVFRVTARVTDAIEDAARWLTGRRDLAPQGRIGMLGVSFSGGLSIVAAGRPLLRDHVAYVASFGSHGNLPRVLRYVCTGIEPAGPDGETAGTERPPHDYGLAVVLYGVADKLVPPDQVQQLRDGVALFLNAAALMRTNPARAAEGWAHAGAFAARMPEPSRTLLEQVHHRNVAALGPRLLPHIGSLGGDPSLSPDQSPAPAAPVYLLHGTEDNVIPAVETRLLAAHLRRSTRVRSLLTGLLGHADITQAASPLEAWRLIAFWKAVIAET